MRVISKVMRDKRIATAAAKMPETLRRENGVEQGVKVVLDEYELAIRDGGSRWDRELAVRAEEMKLKRTLFVHVVQYFERKVGKLSVWYRDRQRRHATPEEKRSTELLTQISDPPKDIPDDHLLDDGNSMNMDHVDSAVPIDGESQIGQNKVGTIGHVSENNHEMISVA